MGNSPSPSPLRTKANSMRFFLISLPFLLSSLACDDPICGPDADALSVVSAQVAGQSISYEDWRSSPNNDCGEVSGPTSLTLEASQVDTGRGFTLCIPRPDKLSGPIDLADTTKIQVVDVFADLPGCLASLDRGRPAAGSVTFAGVCQDGIDPAGYSMALQASVPITLTCGTDVTSELMTIDSNIAITVAPQ